MSNETESLLISSDQESIANTINIPLLLFDLLCLPIHIFRLVIIYIFGSKYNLKGFRFLDVIMHADKPYFNQEYDNVINTIGTDYRVIIRDDSRIFPTDLNKYFDLKKIELMTDNSKDTPNVDNIITGSTDDYLSNDSYDSNIRTNEVLNSIRNELDHALNDD